jgi:hypothetical protein
MISDFYIFIKKFKLMETTTVEINSTVKEFIKEISKWTKFFAILGFICQGLLALVGLIFAVGGSFIPNLPGAAGVAIGILYIGLSFLYYFPCVYLLKFSNYSKAFLTSNSSNDFSMAFQYLKSHYKFVGIATIVILALYIFIMIIALIFGLFAMNQMNSMPQY